MSRLSGLVSYSYTGYVGSLGYTGSIGAASAIGYTGSGGEGGGGGIGYTGSAGSGGGSGGQDVLVSGVNIKTVNGISLLDVTQSDPGSDISLQTAFVNATTVSLYFYYGPGTIAPDATAFYASNPAAFTLTDTSASTLYTGGTYSEPYLDGPPGYTRIDVTGWTASAGAHALTGGGHVLSSPSTPANTNIAIDTLPSLTIGDVYYETNIVSPIPVITTTSYGTSTNVPPLVINGPLSVLSAENSSTNAIFTLSGSNTTGYESGGTNNNGAVLAYGLVNFRFTTALLSTPALASINSIRYGDIITAIGTNGIFTGSKSFTVDRVSIEKPGAGESPGYIVITGQIIGTPPGTTEYFNANVLTCQRPNETSTFIGGVSSNFMSANQVAADHISSNKSITAGGTIYAGSIETRYPGVMQPSMGATTNVILPYMHTDFLDITANAYSGTGYGFTGVYLNLKTHAEHSFRTLTLRVQPIGNDVTWNLPSAAWNLIYYPGDDMAEDGGGISTTQVKWKGGVSSGTMTVGRVYYFTFKLEISQGSIAEIAASVEEFY